MSRRLVVLDIDDTLYLERDYVRSGFSAVDRLVGDSLGAHGFLASAWRLFELGHRGNVFDLALRELGVKSDEYYMQQLVAAYRAHKPEITLTTDSAEFLERLSGSATVAVVTDGPVASQTAKIDALGLRFIADELVVTAERGTDWHKPSAKAFQYLQNLFGVEGSDCVYYGDNPTKDFLGPRSLGWKAVRVRRWGGLHFSNEGGGGSDRTINDFQGEN